MIATRIPRMGAHTVSLLALLLAAVAPAQVPGLDSTAAHGDSLVTVTALIETDEPGTWRRHVGTGLVVGPGLVVTSSYVVQGIDQFIVEGPDGRRVSATLVAGDGLSRLALLRLHQALGTTIDLEAARNPVLGEPVTAMGTAYGFPGKLSRGIVSGLDRTIMDEGLPAMSAAFEISADAEPGMSGAPVFADDGALVGAILIATIPEAGTTHSPLDGGGLVAYNLLLPDSLPSDRRDGPPVVVANPLVLCAEGETLRYAVEGLVAEGQVTWGRVGLSVGPTPMDLVDHFGLGESRGSVVLSVAEDGPADAAGLEAGDVLLATDGQPLDGGGELMRQVLIRPGETLSLEYLRTGERHTTTLTLGTATVPLTGLTENAPGAWIGALVASTSSTLAAQLDLEGAALSVISVAPGSPAAQAGLQAGDVITEVDNEGATAGTLGSAVEAAEGFEITVARAGDSLHLQLTPTAPPPGVVVHSADAELGMTEL